MKTSQLKILAMEFCFNSDLPSKEKKKHLEYIKEEADGYQCIGYILDGKFYNLNESGKKELKKRFIKEQKEERKEFMSKFGRSAGGLVGVGNVGYEITKGRIAPVSFLIHIALTYAGGQIIWGTYRWIRSWFDECTKKCGTFKTNDLDRQKCLQNCKNLRDKKLQELSKKAYKIQQTGKKLNKPLKISSLKK